MKSVNPEIFANFAIPFGEKSEWSRKALAFFRGPEKSPNYIHKTLGRRILRSSVLSFASCDWREACHTHRLNREGIYSFFFMGLRRLAMPSGSRKR